MTLTPFSQLFPRSVKVVESPLAAPPPALLPEESRALGQVAAKREREFAHGRRCARKALEALGQMPAHAIGRGKEREPLFPTGFVGSITHSNQIAVAAAAKAADISSLGLDCEELDRMAPKLWKHTFVEGEIAWITAQPAGKQRRLASAMFCAKEAFYKCQFGLTQAWVGFHDAQVSLEADGAVGVRLLKPLERVAAVIPRLEGAYASDEVHTYAAFWVPRQASDRLP